MKLPKGYISQEIITYLERDSGDEVKVRVTGVYELPIPQTYDEPEQAGSWDDIQAFEGSVELNLSEKELEALTEKLNDDVHRRFNP